MFTVKTSKNDFKYVLMSMLFDTTIKKGAFCSFLLLMLENSTNMMINQKEFRRIAIPTLGISELSYRQTINVLRNRGDIVAKKGYTLFIHPKYKAVLEAKGLFVITCPELVEDQPSQ